MLNLYVWDEVDALEEHAPGYAFALADSREQAIDLIAGHGPPQSASALDLSPWQQRLRVELTAKEPRVITEPEGFAIWGSA